jgi:hypothetical protein
VPAELSVYLGTVTASIALFIAVGAGYLAAHVAFDWLGKRFLIVSGAEYLVLGILLGPQVSGILGASVVDRLAPILTLAIGWIGIIVGTQFELKKLILAPARDFRIGFFESALTFVVVGGLEFAAIHFGGIASDVNALVTSAGMAAVAVASSDAGVTLVANVVGMSGRMVDQLRLSTMLNSLVAIALFGLLLCMVHAPAPASRPLTTTEWAVVSISIGALGGMLFHVFLGETPDRDRLFVALVGGIVMVSGAATYLALSPLLPALCFGIVLVNTTSSPDALVSTLTKVERPFYFVLLIFGGAAWQPIHQEWILPVLLFLVARPAAKIGGARMAARANGALPDFGGNWGLALLGQGRIPLVIGLSYLRQEHLPARDAVFTVAVVSVLLTEFLSARTTRSVLGGHSEMRAGG